MTTLTVDIPVIETERLILREPRMTDFEAYAAFAISDRARFIGGPFDRGGAWRGFSSSIGHWMLFGYGLWMIEDRTTGQPAGRTGIINPDGWPEPELGWHVFEEFEGKGIAFEAAQAARSAAARYFGITTPISFVDPNNTRSRRLAERLGATVEREGELFDKPILIYRHPKDAA